MTFSIRTGMFATTIASLAFVASFTPSGLALVAIASAVVLCVTYAWMSCYSNWPNPSLWSLAFAISCSYLLVSDHELPTRWSNWLVTKIAGEYTGPVLGINKSRDDLRLILNYLACLGLSSFVACALAIIRPRRVNALVITLTGLLTFAASWFVSEIALVVVTATVTFLATWIWVLIVTNRRARSQWIIGFGVGLVTARICFTRRTIPPEWFDKIYGIQHIPPDNYIDVSFEVPMHQEMLMVAGALFLAGGFAALARLLIAPRTEKSEDSATPQASQTD